MATGGTGTVRTSPSTAYVSPARPDPAVDVTDARWRTRPDGSSSTSIVTVSPAVVVGTGGDDPPATRRVGGGLEPGQGEPR